MMKEESSAANGLIAKLSPYSVAETAHKLKEILETKGIKLFALVDHSGEAARTGLSMPPTQVLIFGNPKAGTPVMLASPTSAIDLPLKILIAEDATGRTWVSYNSPEFLRERHGIPEELLPNLAVIELLVAQITQ
ncbi:MAG TPA: DUF302 domain-containing protein [Acidobacteriaceae bacterium]